MADAELVHVNVTANPTAAWMWRQLIEATPWGQKPRHLLRDRDAVYGRDFHEQARRIGADAIATPVVRARRLSTTVVLPSDSSSRFFEHEVLASAYPSQNLVNSSQRSSSMPSASPISRRPGLCCPTTRVSAGASAGARVDRRGGGRPATSAAVYWPMDTVPFMKSCTLHQYW